MTTDNPQGDLSPMLSQPATDNAPMISGRGTKIIADARGAYLARNLDGLIEHMDETQRQRLTDAFIHQVVIFARRLLEDERDNSELHALLPDIERMLNQPTVEHADIVLERRIIQPSIVHLTGRLIKHPFAEGAFVFAAIQSRELLGLSFADAIEWAHNWRLETAWAVVQRRDPLFWDGNR